MPCSYSLTEHKHTLMGLRAVARNSPWEPLDTVPWESLELGEYFATLRLCVK
jgi:hypothetical protein